MPSDSSYTQATNRRIAGARFQLSLLEQQELTLTPLQKNACLEAALGQLQLALGHYCNEIIESYKLDAIDYVQHPLSALLAGSEHYKNVTELNELRNWYNQASSALFALVHMQNRLFTFELIEIEIQSNTIFSTADQKPLANGNDIRLLLKGLTELINRQRENLAEH